MRKAKEIIVGLLGLLACSGIAASSASAFHPLFVTGSGFTLKFTSTGGTSILTGLLIGLVFIIKCEKNSGSGEVLNRTTLLGKVELLFNSKCEFASAGQKSGCTEPIEIKLARGELGLLSSFSHRVLLLLGPESGSEFLTAHCGSGTLTVSGSVIGEFPEINKSSENQYNKPLSSFELVFATSGGRQAITEIELLNVHMTGVHLSFQSREASEELTENLAPDGVGEISTR